MEYNKPDDTIESLRAENSRLISLLELHGIAWQKPEAPVSRTSRPTRYSTVLSTDNKVALFRRLFRGRTDVYPVRWESKTSGKTGYSPACANEWRTGICEKPRVKCADCDNRLFITVARNRYQAGAAHPRYLLDIAVERGGHGHHVGAFLFQHLQHAEFLELGVAQLAPQSPAAFAQPGV